MKRDHNSNLFMLLGITFCACLLISNVCAFKLISLGPIVITSGVLLFPITYIINDLIAEVYGYQKVKKVIWAGFAMNILMVAYFQLAIALPYPPFFNGQESFQTVLSSTWRILVASLAAYLVGSFMNAAVLSKMKVKTQGRFFMVRAVVSTLVGEFFDSVLFVVIAFAFTYDLRTIITMVLTQTAVKTLYELLISPVTSIIVKKVKAYEDTDVYDTSESYNPFGR